MKPFGAYVHARPDGRIFYVGKGKEKRARNLRRNSYHAKVVNKYGDENVLVGFIPCSSEEIAFALEMGIIKCLRRMGVALTNQTDGGEGPSGLIQSDEAKAKVSRANKGRSLTAEHKAKISAAGMGNKYSLGRVLPQEHKLKISATLTGRARPADVRAKISKGRIGQVFTPETRLKMRHAKLGTHASFETRTKMSCARKGNQHTAGRICICKDGEVRVIKPEQREAFTSDGWKRGRK